MLLVAAISFTLSGFRQTWTVPTTVTMSPTAMSATLTPGLAQMIPKNAVIGLQIHYVTTGKEEESTISIGTGTTSRSRV